MLNVRLWDGGGVGGHEGKKPKIYPQRPHIFGSPFKVSFFPSGNFLLVLGGWGGFGLGGGWVRQITRPSLEKHIPPPTPPTRFCPVLPQVYFRKTGLCQLLMDEAKSNVLQNIDLKSTTSKLLDFIDRCQGWRAPLLTPKTRTLHNAPPNLPYPSPAHANTKLSFPQPQLMPCVPAPTPNATSP